MFPTLCMSSSHLEGILFFVDLQLISSTRRLQLPLVGHFCSIPLGGFSYNLSHLEENFYVFENI